MINFTFQMPHLSRYTFYVNGSVWSNEKQKFLSMQDGGKFSPRYKLLKDDNEFEWIRQSEIISYGNHCYEVHNSKPTQYVIYRPFILHRTHNVETVKKW